MTEDMLTLHRRHLIACGVEPGRALAVDSMPTTRNDLREHYQAIIDGAIPRPKWAGQAPATIGQQDGGK